MRGSLVSYYRQVTAVQKLNVKCLYLVHNREAKRNIQNILFYFLSKD